MRVIKALQHTPEFNVKAEADAHAKLTNNQNLIDSALSFSAPTGKEIE